MRHNQRSDIVGQKQTDQQNLVLHLALVVHTRKWYIWEMLAVGNFISWVKSSVTVRRMLVHECRSYAALLQRLSAISLCCALMWAGMWWCILMSATLSLTIGYNQEGRKTVFLPTFLSAPFSLSHTTSTDQYKSLSNYHPAINMSMTCNFSSLNNAFHVS